FNHHMADRIAIAADEAVAPVVEGQAELAYTADRLGGSAGRVEAEIHAVDRNGRLVAARAMVDHRATTQTVGDVDAIVDAEPGMVGSQLGVAFDEASEPGFVAIGPAVAVFVFQIGDSARFGD